VTLVDANLLVYAVNHDSPEHGRAATWLEERLNGSERTGIPWESLTAFIRIVTNPRIAARPLLGSDAWRFVEEWLAVPVVWIPGATDAHATVLGSLVAKYRLSGNAIPDAHLAAIAIQHGLDVASADTDFARFAEIRWHNPLA
jgi:toxin-antitoxin system PIN domain toxin